MKPPSGGPTIGPTSAGIVTQAIAATRSLFSTVRTSTSRPTGVIIAPPMPCNDARQHELLSASRERAADRAEHEDDDGRDEDGAGAETVGDPAAGRNEDGERQQIGGDRELERERARADIGRDGRQRRRDDGRVHVFHEHGRGDDQRYDALTPHGAPQSLEQGSKS